MQQRKLSGLNSYKIGEIARWIHNDWQQLVVLLALKTQQLSGDFLNASANRKRVHNMQEHDFFK